MKATVCQLRNDPMALAEDWQALADHTRAAGSDLVLLPEMPFSPWLAASREADPAAWKRSLACHEEWLDRLPELAAETVLLTRPVVEGGSAYNEAAVWSRNHGTAVAVHRKRYLPDEEGFWEAHWYSRGPAVFDPAETTAGTVGFLICTELWFNRHARDYGRRGVQLLACPRATLAATTGKWIAGGRVAAVVSGAFCLSSNLAGPAGLGSWGGTGWIIEPEEGEVLGTTSAAEPFLTLDLDLAIVARAQSTYPRYVRE